MNDLFGDEEEENLDFGLNSDYAKKYEAWRQKEELQKLKTRYGDDPAFGEEGNDSTSSEEEDENAVELTQQLEKDFFKTLSYLKKKDPSIYDENFKFFQKQYTPQDTSTISKNKKDDKPMFLRDYERKIIIERNGKLSDEDEDDNGRRNRALTSSPTIIEEQEDIKQSFKNVLKDDDENDTAWGGLFEKRKKTSHELEKENEDFREWLKGQHVQLKDKNTESDLKHLHDFWNDPKLDSTELFLKDYILNKKFLGQENKDHIPTYDEIVHDSDDDLSEDEATITKQEEFEHKFNFRFEEPDQEFIKRFPRTMENSLRRKDTRRKEKREEIKKRKEAQKESMKEDLKRLKSLKRKEIMDKIAKLKEVTGNPSFGFQNDDLEGDFDPDNYDKRMSELFTEDYYEQGDCEEKPEFPDIDRELELENWDGWDEIKSHSKYTYEDEPHCEDPDFNMDCDFNPTAQFQTDIIESTKGRRKNKKSKLAQALATKKPIFDPSDNTFEQYVDEYYGLDYEDMIGDLPCRFKYRKVVPNSFGLTIEEILKANDKELNQWCSLKKTVQHRPNYVEQKDIEKYDRKSKNINYKKKILTSLYHDEQPDATNVKQIKKKAKKLKKLDNKTNPTPTSGEIRTIENAPGSSQFKNSLVSKQTSSNPKRTKNERNKNHEKCQESPCTLMATDLGNEHIVSQGEQLMGKEKDISKKRKIIDDSYNIDSGSIKKPKIVTDPSALFASNANNVTKKKKKKVSKKNSSHAVCSTSVNTQIFGKDTTMSRRKKKNNKQSLKKQLVSSTLQTSSHVNSDASPPVQILCRKKKNKSFNHKNSDQVTNDFSISNARLQAYGLNPKKYKNFLKYGKTDK